MRSVAVRLGSVLAVLGCIIVTAVHAQAPTPTVDSLISQAKAAAGTDWAGTFLRLCIPPPAPAAAAGRGRGGAAPGPPARETWYARPAKVADNFYFLGTKIHSAWAIVGTDGIIVLEALFDYAAPDEVVGGMKQLGLDLSRVKYIVISHAHADHDGGAKLLQDSMPNAHLVYGGPDWEAVDRAANHQGGKPKHDMVGTDGATLSVGDASLKLVTTPGHTPGTLSFLFEVRDHGKPIRVAYVGGTAIPFNGTDAYYDGYIASAKKMAAAADAFGATALISNHSEFDDAYFKAHTAQDRKGSDSNHFDVGKPAVQRYFTVVEDCATAAKLRATAR